VSRYGNPNSPPSFEGIPLAKGDDWDFG
jgi:hypothetical protein